VSHIVSNVVRDGEWEAVSKVVYEFENAGAGFDPGGEVRDMQ